MLDVKLLWTAQALNSSVKIKPNMMNNAESNKLTLGIDARPLARGYGGIQTYLRELLPHLIENGKFQIVLFVDSPTVTLPQSIEDRVTVKYIATTGLRAVAWQVMIPLWLRREQVDIFWSPRHHLPTHLPKACRAVVSIHDFVWKTVPETMPLLQRISERILMPLALRRADKIICVSDTTKNQLTTHYPQFSGKCVTVLHGSPEMRLPSRDTQSKHMKHFLCVGTLEPRKNYERTIKAFDLYAQRGGTKNLKIIGAEGWKYSTIFNTHDAIENRSRVTFEKAADQAQLDASYRSAYAFLSLSLDEGYGLPPHEAAAYGLPLLLSDIPVYRELIPHANFWADPESVESIAEAMLRLDSLEKNGSAIPNSTEDKGSPPRFSWAECARLTSRHIAATA